MTSNDVLIKDVANSTIAFRSLKASTITILGVNTQKKQRFSNVLLSCDKKNPTLVVFSYQLLLNSFMKTLLSSPEARLITFS